MVTDKHRKRLIVSIAIIIVFIILITYYIYLLTPYSSRETVPVWEYKGTIVYNIDERGNFWGLKISFWDRPLGERKLRFGNLPKEFQIEQLKVKVKYGMYDVIGTNDWDVIIDVINIQKI